MTARQRAAVLAISVRAGLMITASVRHRWPCRQRNADHADIGAGLVGAAWSSVDARQPLELLSFLVRQNRNYPGIAVRARSSTRVLGRPNCYLASASCVQSRGYVWRRWSSVSRSASEPVRASLVFFHASLDSEIDNAITLLHAAPTRPAPMSA